MWYLENHGPGLPRALFLPQDLLCVISIKRLFVTDLPPSLHVCCSQQGPETPSKSFGFSDRRIGKVSRKPEPTQLAMNSGILLSGSLSLSLSLCLCLSPSLSLCVTSAQIPRGQCFQILDGEGISRTSPEMQGSLRYQRVHVMYSASCSLNPD